MRNTERDERRGGEYDMHANTLDYEQYMKMNTIIRQKTQEERKETKNEKKKTNIDTIDT